MANTSVSSCQTLTPFNFAKKAGRLFWACCVLLIAPSASSGEKFVLGSIDEFVEVCANAHKVYTTSLEKMGFEVVHIIQPYKRMFSLLERGGIDGLTLAGQGPRSGNKEIMRVGPIWTEMPVYLFKNVSVKTNELKELNLVIPLGVAVFEYLDKNRELKNIQRVSGFQSALDMVERNRADATASTTFIYDKYNQQFGLGNVVRSKQPLAHIKLVGMVSVKHQAIVGRLGDLMTKELEKTGPGCHYD